MATWVIDAGLLTQTGLQCRGHHYLREYYQETADGTSYSQNQYNYDYLPNFAVGRAFPVLAQQPHRHPAGVPHRRRPDQPGRAVHLRRAEPLPVTVAAARRRRACPGTVRAAERGGPGCG